MIGICQVIFVTELIVDVSCQFSRFKVCFAVLTLPIVAAGSFWHIKAKSSHPEELWEAVLFWQSTQEKNFALSQAHVFSVNFLRVNPF